jgi:hypothetical protein
MNQMHSQLQFVQSLLSRNATTSGDNNANSNTKFAQTHVTEALAFLNQKDPVNNFTWNQEIAERNQRVATDLVRGLNDLSTSVNQKASSTSIQDKVNNLGGLLNEAISARVAKDILNNSTNQALVLANMGNEVFYSYGQALGFPYVKLANMVATMNMSAMGGNNMNMQGKNMKQNMNNMNNMNANSNKMPGMTMTNKVNILNESQYQNAQAYVKQAQEIVSKYLTSPSSTNKNITSADIQTQLNKILSQLKTTIDNKGPFNSVMTLVHMQLHPTLISDYGLKLNAPTPSK